ncbi:MULTISPECIES: exo-alpha-sialidase [unclassified Arenibacter]|uniref:sialidase family protein n=1 Tax=unclassified Arenibacter TaxID=2615047 RepID=UPI0015F2A622|nr:MULTISPECIES: exo-alpha-sialidase [unclassified Arenibacter]
MQFLTQNLMFVLTMSIINIYGQGPILKKEMIFPIQGDHVHSSTILELKNGDVLIGWFQGSGERWADDVQIMGARKRKGSDYWSKPFLLADVKGFPDCNPQLFIDGKDRLWLMWYTVLANQWETSLLKYRISDNYLNMEGSPEWIWQADLHIKPGDKAERGILPDDSFVKSVESQTKTYLDYIISTSNDTIISNRWEKWADKLVSKARGDNMVRQGRIYNTKGEYDNASLGYPYFRRLGWQTQNKPFITNSGRMIVPLYSDGFGFSLMAFTDDWGENWDFSNPLVGSGNIQPAIAQGKSGELVAYMRDNGPAPKRLQISRSFDNGKSWSDVRDTEIPNPGSGADIVTLENGNWVMVYNDAENNRNSLAVALSEDNGKSWPWHKRIEDRQPPIRSHYPAIIVGTDGMLHVSYSYFETDTDVSVHRKTIKHAVFNVDWIKN